VDGCWLWWTFAGRAHQPGRTVVLCRGRHSVAPLSEVGSDQSGYRGGVPVRVTSVTGVCEPSNNPSAVGIAAEKHTGLSTSFGVRLSPVAMIVRGPGRQSRGVGRGSGREAGGREEYAEKTKRPRLKESRDARPNSPPPSAAQEQDYLLAGKRGMAPMGYSGLLACRADARR
jgi:hypothetical protein